MYADISKPPAALPSIKLEVLRPGLSLLWPLSRRGRGPGLIILSTAREDPVAFYDGVPSSMVKWAEEGYAVVQIEAAAFEGKESEVVLREAIEALRQCEKCELNDKVGLVGTLSLILHLKLSSFNACLAYEPLLWNLAASGLDQVVEIVASVLYADAQTVESLAPTVKPLLKHIASQDFRPASQSQYPYREATTYAFATPGHPHFDYTTESVSHTRNLQFLKPKLNGPYFDLEAIWNEHTWYEFSDRSVEHTMGTMVQEPYVNHVPTVRNKAFYPIVPGLKKTTNYCTLVDWWDWPDETLQILSG
jgi:carboxymethylenebutenolidase